MSRCRPTPRVRRRRARARPANDIRASSASVLVAEVVGGPHRGVLAGQPRAEEQRVVGAQRDRGAGGEQLGQRHRRQVGVDAEGDVGDRAHLEGDAAVDDADRAGRGPRRPGRRGPAGRRAARRGTSRMCSGPSSSPPCGVSSRPARSAIRKAPANSAVRPRRSSLERPNPTTPRPAYCPASRASVRASSGCRVRLAAITTAMPSPVDREASSTASSTRSVNAVMPPNRAAYPLGSTWISSHRPPSTHVVLGGLTHQPAYVGLACAAPTGPRRRDAGTGTSPSRRPPTAAGGQSSTSDVGQVDAVALGQLEQGAVPHGPGEVQVEMRLREGRRILPSHLALRARCGCGTHPLLAPSQANSFWSRLMPSTRSSSPSA